MNKQIEMYTAMTDEERREVLLDLLSQLDPIPQKAFVIHLKSVASGESWRTASKKAAAFLLTQPGYEKMAQRWMQVALEVRYHDARRMNNAEPHRTGSSFLEDYPQYTD